jgi:hypothetical protein
MHQFVQSAIDAANQGDKNKAMSFLKEVITANPKDADAWLVLAAIVDEPERKRQCLNRVLSLDPTNKLAREELLDMDRAAMSGTPPFTSEPDPTLTLDDDPDPTQDRLASVSRPKTQPRQQPSMSLESNKPAAQPIRTQANHVSLKEWAEESPKRNTQGMPGSQPQAEKPAVFRYSILTQITIYALAVIALSSFLFALQNINLLFIPCVSSLLVLPGVWIVSAQVELSEKGIRVAHLFSLTGSEVLGWNEIATIKSNSLKRNLELTTKKGSKLKVTTQVKGYPTIVETLRQKRPDLFGMAQPQPSSTWGNGSAAQNGNSSSRNGDIPGTIPTFSGIRTFKKSFFRQYGLLFLLVPMGLLAALTALTEAQYRLGAGITAVVCFLMMILPFLQIGLVKVEPNKLTIESFLEHQTFNARDIKDIQMASVHGRYGRVTNYVNIIPVKGKKNYPMQGFSDGDEIIYGILRQWWEVYRNR